jgi:hypothetical protein
VDWRRKKVRIDGLNCGLASGTYRVHFAFKVIVQVDPNYISPWYSIMASNVDHRASTVRVAKCNMLDIAETLILQPGSHDGLVHEPPLWLPGDAGSESDRHFYAG